MKKVYITIVNPIEKSSEMTSELYENTDLLYLDKALGKHNLRKSDLSVKTVTNSGVESPIIGNYVIYSGVISGTSKLITIVECDWL